jgi:prophage antirepressor-like protein
MESTSDSLITKVFDGHEIRVVGEEPPMVVLSDIARALSYRDAPNFARHISDEYKGYHRLETDGGVQEMICTTKKGLIESLWHISPRDEEKKKSGRELPRLGA